MMMKMEEEEFGAELNCASDFECEDMAADISIESPKSMEANEEMKASPGPGGGNEEDLLADPVQENFQNCRIGDREYYHQLRSNYNKFGKRVDFTQTLMVLSGLELKSKDGKLRLQKHFYLND